MIVKHERESDHRFADLGWNVLPWTLVVLFVLIDIHYQASSWLFGWCDVPK